MGEASSSSRRGFLVAVSGAVATALAAAVTVPALVMLLDRGRRRPAGEGPRSYADLTELPVGVPRKVDVVAIARDAWDRSARKMVGAIWLVRRDDRRVDAFSAVCPHLGCAIGFDDRRRAFICPCHQGEFALADGACVKGPSPRGLDPLPAEVREGKVFVTYQRFVLGIARRLLS